MKKVLFLCIALLISISSIGQDLLREKALGMTESTFKTSVTGKFVNLEKGDSKDSFDKYYTYSDGVGEMVLYYFKTGICTGISIVRPYSNLKDTVKDLYSISNYDETNDVFFKISKGILYSYHLYYFDEAFAIVVTYETLR
jgi:hypothetical protein